MAAEMACRGGEEPRAGRGGDEPRWDLPVNMPVRDRRLESLPTGGDAARSGVLWSLLARDASRAADDVLPKDPKKEDFFFSSDIFLLSRRTAGLLF